MTGDNISGRYGPLLFRRNLEETESFGRWHCCCIVDGGGGIVEVMEMASALCFG